MNIGIRPILTKLKDALSELYGDRLVRVTLFGSQARDDYSAESDIDILVVLRSAVDPAEEISRTGAIVADLCLEYEVVISCIFVEETDYQSRRTALLRNVHREGVTL